MLVNTCPCCGSNQLLRHARRGGVYWLCMSCRQEVLPLAAYRHAIGREARISQLSSVR